eukprot:CAMPEP_0172477234 /NCGR_PEP_ID=MMETSP1066-20121228/170_1 /TAXON_ID=671091 /ORGANISM="Coscinodiscus wailesii, Strain CCMP2513" /LENGTH=426 /DNA_ID=CAMNT_0013235527 /DNA_START=72 /DNA_END=1352 /DNA_ORIENTATION=-
MFGHLALALLVATSSVTATPFSGVPAQTKNDGKASFVSKVMSNARRLDEDNEVDIDLSAYSIKFVKCQFIKSYDDELAEEGADSVLKTNRFIIFRLCPSSSCAYNYGEYMVPMDDYLEAAVEYQAEQQEEMCNYCAEVCVNDDAAAEGDDAAEEEEEDEDEDGDEDGDERRKLRSIRRKLAQNVDCSSCGDECEKIENMEDNGYVEASNFIQCQQIGADDDGTEYYAGAMCASSGEKIKIGVFMDEDCSQLDSSLSAETYIGAQLSHALLKTVYESDTLVPCVKPNWDVPADDDAANGDDAAEEEVEENEMCVNLYEPASKCETKHGFQSGLSDNADYYNQYAQEELVCALMDTVSNGAYDETGEIVLKSKSTNIEGATEATGGQKFALTVFILGTVGLAVFAAQLHSKLMKGGTDGLSNQGGAMA